MLCLVTQSYLTLCNPMDCSPSGSSVWGGLPYPPPGDLPNPGWNPGLLHCMWDSLPPEPPGKPKNTGLGSLSLLQGVFLTQESNQGLLHCRWILYRLELSGKPFPVEVGSISSEPHHLLVCVYLIVPLTVVSEK